MSPAIPRARFSNNALAPRVVAAVVGAVVAWAGDAYLRACGLSAGRWSCQLSGCSLTLRTVAGLMFMSTYYGLLTALAFRHFALFRRTRFFSWVAITSSLLTVVIALTLVLDPTLFSDYGSRR